MEKKLAILINIHRLVAGEARNDFLLINNKFRWENSRTLSAKCCCELHQRTAAYHANSPNEQGSDKGGSFARGLHDYSQYYVPKTRIYNHEL